MPPKKRKPIGKVLPKVSKKRNVRSAETAVQREHRLRINRERASTSRAAESVGQRENRLQQERDRASTSRAAESLEQRENRLQQERDRASTSRAAESVGQRENRLRQKRNRASTSRAAESVGQRENRLQQDRDRASTSRAAESLGQRENRLQQERDRASTSRAAESLEQRENRLQQERDRASTSRAAESVGQRENRLRQNRNRASTSRAAESLEQRENRLQQERDRASTSRAAESVGQRENRLRQNRNRRQLSRMCGTSLKTINNIIHKDLELDTRRKGKLYEEHLAGSRSEYTATLDEAWMFVTYCNGIRKICYIKRGNQVPDNWVHQCSETFLKGFMVVGVMTGRGVLPLIKVPSKVKVNSEFYIECVLKPVIEQLKDLYPGEMDKVFLHHDKASSHTSNKTQQFLQEMKDTLGLNFIRNSDIPVKSPDASPLDFYGFALQSLVENHQWVSSDTTYFDIYEEYVNHVLRD
ncbi:IKK1 [Cordylochernes scorpioides]|uniref:IKK1 n=1 Tax=Cordylochernes scorpioides TaxID=51811 RepID=A0ABY6JYK3_9ARAC|nr:IKK1 [Cordylochernes scorpioides]